MNLTTRTLGEICDEVVGIIRTGPFGSQLHESDYIDEGVPVVMPKNIVEGKVSVEDIARISEGNVRRLAQHKLHEGDIVYARRGDIGRRALITKREAGWLCGTGCLRISLGKNVLNPYFLYYFLGQANVVAWIANQAVGATLPNLNTGIIRSIKVTYPSLPTQHKIAAILSAYDNLIENNTRRIAILEEMAQSLYREWFMHFRFPGHEKNTMVESPLGMIPEGWEVKAFGNVALNYDSKRKPLSSLQRAEMQGIYPYYGAAKIFDYVDAYLFDGKYLLIAEDGSVMTEDKKPVLQMVTGKFWPNNHTHVIQGKQPVSTNFLYHFIKELDVSGYVTGAAQPKITQANLNRIPLIVATESVLKLFDEQVGPSLLLINALERKNANLRRTRDLLLPKLISGELYVEALDIEVGEFAEVTKDTGMQEQVEEVVRQDEFAWG